MSSLKSHLPAQPPESQGFILLQFLKNIVVYLILKLSVYTWCLNPREGGSTFLYVVDIFMLFAKSKDVHQHSVAIIHCCSLFVCACIFTDIG